MGSDQGRLTELGHEVRNAVAPITSALQVMRLHLREPARIERERLAIERNVERLIRVIDELLEGQLSASLGTPASARDDAAPIWRRLRIIVVDDNVDAAETLRDLLVEMGHSVRSTYDGESAISWAATWRPDLMLVDLAMPWPDGHEVARRVRDMGIPTSLVAVTGYGGERHRRLAQDAGFDLHVTKPVDERKLDEVLEVARVQR